MAKKALINKQQAKPKFKVRGYTLPPLRARGPCTGSSACAASACASSHAGEVPGLTKSSW